MSLKLYRMLFIRGRCKRQTESQRKCLPRVTTTATQSQQSLTAGQRKQQCYESPRITEKGKPLTNTQVGLRGILLNHHKRPAALPQFIFVLRRLHSRQLLCFIQKNAQILSESVTVTHWVTDAHPFVSCVSCCSDCFIYNTMFLSSLGKTCFLNLFFLTN